ncbi:hypothetical protein [Bacillus sp. JCM 19041]
MADALRNAGKKVVIQDVDGIESVDRISSIYDMHYVVSKTSGGMN